MSGYCHFKTTGNDIIDNLLLTITQAGNASHSTAGWQESLEHYDGKSYIDLIQEAADLAASRLDSRSR